MHQSRHAEHCTLRAHRSVVCWQWVAGRAPKPDSCIALLFFNTKKPLHPVWVGAKKDDFRISGR